LWWSPHSAQPAEDIHVQQLLRKKVFPWAAFQQQLTVVIKPAEKLALQPVITQATPASEEGTGELCCAQRHQAAVRAVPLEIQDWCKESGENTD